MGGNKCVRNEKETPETNKDEYPTSKCIQVQNIAEFMDKYNLSVSKCQIFQFCSVNYIYSYKLFKNNIFKYYIVNRSENQ